MSLSRGRAPRRVLPAVAAAPLAALAAAAFLVLTAVPALAGTGPAPRTAAGSPAAAGGAPIAGSAGSSGPGGSPADRSHLTLLSQSNWVTPAQGGVAASFTLALAAKDAPAGARVSVALYKRLYTRAGFEATLRSPPSQSDTREIDHTAPVRLSALQPAAGGGVELHVAVEPSASGTSAPPGGTPTLDLTCMPSVTCTGVYPAVVTLTGPSGNDLGHLTTYLTYVQAASAHRLRFAWVVPISSRTSLRAAATDPGAALAPLPRRTATAIEGLIAALHTSGIPVTVEPVPQTLQALGAAGAAGRAAVSTLAAMTARPSFDGTLAQTYVPVDLGALAGAGEPTEIKAQVEQAAAVLQKYHVAIADPATWVTPGQIGASTGTGLAQVGAKRVVVRDTQLAAPSYGPQTKSRSIETLSWPFPLTFGPRGPTVTAAAADSVLSSQFTADRGDPALAAAKVLADLAMVHFEAPYTAKARGMVAVPPSGWHPTAAFDRQLLAGLDNNPVVQPVTLSTFFTTVPPAGTRHLSPGGGGRSLPASLAQQLSTARLRLSAFDGAVTGAPTLLTHLDQDLLAAEARYRSNRGMRSAVGAFERVFGHQLSLVQLSTEGSITLTARTGWIPVTVVSNAPYTIKGTLTLSSAKFRFPPSGAGCTGKARPARATSAASRSTSCSMALDHATNPVRIDVRALTLGDSPVTVVFSVPGLVLARGQLTVRSTATSVVGVVLTAVALTVLLAWWARTWRAGRRRRRAAGGEVPARGA